MWQALGEYRGPLSVRAFMRYAEARHKAYLEEFGYRAYMSKLMGSYLGASVSWLDLIDPPADFDAHEVVEGVIERAGLEVIH